MPVRAIVSPKFTYGQDYKYCRLFLGTNSSNSYKNGMFDYDQQANVMPSIVIMPPIEFPVCGNGHSCRKSNRITITSIRIKMTFQMQSDILVRTSLFTQNIVPSAQDANLPLNPQLFMKFRLFLIQVDDDIDITEKKILNWFYATHCYYRSPTVEEVVNGPTSTTLTTSPPPVSVHSNVLRLTTPWTGKFNVLADRKFTVKTTKPQFDIDMTIPLRKEYVFDEDYSLNSKLLYPKLYCFILPPLSYEVDVDPYTTDWCKETSTGKNENVFNVYSWTKLNFVDL